MKRTNIYLSIPQHRAVAKEAKKRGVSASEVIRDLIDEGLLQRDYERKLTYTTSTPSTAPRRAKRYGADDGSNQHLPDSKTA